MNTLPTADACAVGPNGENQNTGAGENTSRGRVLAVCTTGKTEPTKVLAVCTASKPERTK